MRIRIVRMTPPRSSPGLEIIRSRPRRTPGRAPGRSPERRQPKVGRPPPLSHPRAPSVPDQDRPNRARQPFCAPPSPAALLSRRLARKLRRPKQISLWSGPMTGRKRRTAKGTLRSYLERRPALQRKPGRQINCDNYGSGQTETGHGQPETDSLWWTTTPWSGSASRSL